MKLFLIIGIPYLVTNVCIRNFWHEEEVDSSHLAVLVSSPHEKTTLVIDGSGGGTASGNSANEFGG